MKQLTLCRAAAAALCLLLLAGCGAASSGPASSAGGASAAAAAPPGSGGARTLTRDPGRGGSPEGPPRRGGGPRGWETPPARDARGVDAATRGKSLYTGALDLAECVRRYETKG